MQSPEYLIFVGNPLCLPTREAFFYLNDVTDEAQLRSWRRLDRPFRH